MKIKIYGGPLAIAYNLAKFFKRRNMDITLYTDRDPLDESYRPTWEDDDLRPENSGWIKEVDIKLGNCVLKGEKEKEFLEEIRDADILHMYGESNIWASLAGLPYIYHSYGYDLDQMPFRRGSVKSSLLSNLLKRSIKKSKCVILSPHQTAILKRLKLDDVKTEYIPCPIDTDKYRRHDTDLTNKLKANGNFDFIFFSPTRHEWTYPYTSNKGNDKVINAFSKFIKTGRKALLVLVDKGDDVEKSKALIAGHGLEGYVMWIKPQNKKAMIEFYSASDIVFDQFTLGGFGQVFLESMSCGVPTFIYLKGYENLYSDQPPCINVFSVDDIFRKLVELTSKPKILKEIGNKSRQWIIEYHDWKISVERLKNLYERILN